MRYLPLFYEDLEEKVTYIAEKLKNPKVANDLLGKMEAVIMERLPMAESFEYTNGYRAVEFAGSNDYPYNLL